MTNLQAEALGKKLESSPVYLTPDASSWYILRKAWMPSTPSSFEKEWAMHPEDFHALQLFGKTVHENRYSQSWGVSYSYSGSTNVARPLDDSVMVQELIQKANELLETTAYNACLQNWYHPEHTIGLHADDERDMIKGMPIFSLSWGGTRRFVFVSRSKKENTDVWLEDGDLLVMGGTCQETHRHQVPKVRVTKDPPTSDRINWTIRAFHRNDYKEVKAKVK